MRMVRYFWMGLLLGVTMAVQAAQTQARLILAADTARPGETVLAGLHLHMAKGWYTYWRNPGDSGKGTEIKWTLPTGVTAGSILWPVPEKQIMEDLTSYHYGGDTVLLVPLTLAKDLAPGELNLKGDVSWLECETMCVPGKATVQAKLTVGPASKASASASMIEAAQKALPRQEPKLAVKAWWEKDAANNSRPLIMEWTPVHTADGADFYPYEIDKLEIKGETTVLPATAGTVRIRKTIKKLEGDWPTRLSGLVIEQLKGQKAVGYEVRVPIGAQTAATVGSTTNAINGKFSGDFGNPTRGQFLFSMLMFAFLGGLILNVMPCVLPVISLKILSFVKQSREEPRQVRKLGVIYVLGVLVSFLVMAGIVIALQQAGRKANWGMQFQNLQFLIAMTILITLVSLNLFGLFEVNLSGGVMGAAGQLTGKGGASGAFFNGVLATILATPCTAPFLAPALGYAFAQPPVIILLMFVAIGLGLSVPYILLSLQPGWLRFLPKPGAWMEKFKIIMGFPMLAVAFWLFTIASTQLSKSGTFAFGIFLVSLALAAWIWGEFVQRGSARKVLAMAACLLLVGGIGAYALNQHQGSDLIAWQPWSPQAVTQARAAGRPVLVDFTADWCATCQLNKRTSIEVAPVEAKLKEINAVTLIGDYTKEDPAITDELKRFDRAGVPLVLVFPKDPAAEPIVLPAFLTRGLVMEALNRAAGAK